METLKQRNITHILTLDICPLPAHITECPHLTTKYVHGNETLKQLNNNNFPFSVDANMINEKNIVIINISIGYTQR